MEKLPVMTAQEIELYLSFCFLDGSGGLQKACRQEEGVSGMNRKNNGADI